MVTKSKLKTDKTVFTSIKIAKAPIVKVAKVVKETYVRNAEVIRVIDGDTAEFKVNLGCDININMRSRLEGIDAPEKATKDGKISKKRLEDTLPIGKSVVIQTTKDKKEKYGRYLVTVFVDGVNINQQLLDEKMAIFYNNGKKA